jgi:mandelate racemase
MQTSLGTLPRVQSLNVRSVEVPIPVPHRTASGTLSIAPLALIDLRFDDGVVGRSYLFSYTPIALRALRNLLEDLGAVIAGMPLAPREIYDSLQAKFRLLGPQGLVLMALAGIDMAAWDALAVYHDVPLCRLLGGSPRDAPAYDSLGMCEPHAAAADAAKSAAQGFPGVKFKIGGKSIDDDLELVSRVRESVGSVCEVMVDYNQSLGAAEAIRRGTALEPFQLAWIEEPCRADDDEGHAAVARALTTPIQLGENWWGPNEAARSIRAGACDEIMLDVMKIGGVSGWLEAMTLAAAAGKRVSSHLFPEFSVHLLSVTPNARYLEWLDLASPILKDPLAPHRGRISVPARPGAGVVWDEKALSHFGAA